MEWLVWVMGAMVVVMVIMMVMKEILGMGKKPRMIEIPRDTKERLVKAHRMAIKGKLNKTKMRHRLWVSGDEMFVGYRVGDIMAYQNQNEMYTIWIRKYWFAFWQKVLKIKVEPMFCTDFNCRDVIIDARGFEAMTEGENYPIPPYLTADLEKLYIARENYNEATVLKQTLDDYDTDMDIIPKVAMRGDYGFAMSELGRYEEMPTIPEKDLKKKQKQMVNESMSGRGNMGGGGQG